MNKDHHDKAVSITTGRRCGDSGPWAVFTEGFRSSIRRFGSAIRLLLATFSGVLAVMSLGTAMIFVARELTPTAQRFMMLAGEGLLLLSGVGMLIGCVLAWAQVFRASISSSRGASKSIQGEHDEHR